MKTIEWIIPFHSCYFFHNNIPLRQEHIDKVPEIQGGWSLASSSTNVILVTLFFSQLVAWYCTGTKKCLVIFHVCTHLVHVERNERDRQAKPMAVKKVVKSIHGQLTITQSLRSVRCDRVHLDPSCTQKKLEDDGGDFHNFVGGVPR